MPRGIPVYCFMQVLVSINITKTTIGSKKHPDLEWTFFGGVQSVVMPLAYVNRHATMTDAQASQFKGQVYLATDVMAGLFIGGIALAVLLSLSSFACGMTGYLRLRTLSRYSDVAVVGLYQPLSDSQGDVRNDTLSVAKSQVQ